MDKVKDGFSRRRFLGTTAAAAAFTIVPRHVLGGPGFVPPSEKLNIAGIGIGGQGRGDMRHVASENIVALCDIDDNLAAKSYNMFPKARQWKDYRRMLEEQKDIDAVVIATGDHLHAAITMMALKMKKHVFCEKPLTHSVYEARQISKAAKEASVATQMGNQGQAGEATRRLREVIWDGAIGDVTEVHVWTDRPNKGLTGVHWPQGVARPKDTPPVPSHIDWDLFCGPAPLRPYHPAYHPFRWRGWLDFGTGAMGDMGCHLLDPIFRVLKLGHPLTVQAVSSRVNKETYPLASIIKYEFPARGDMGAVKLTWYDGGMKPHRPEELEDGRKMGNGGTLFIGTKGKILDGRIIPESKQAKYKLPPKTLVRSPGHFEEWINACKGGDRAGSNFDFAGPLTEVVLLGNVALRMELKEQMCKHKLHWDPQAFKITNLPEANQFLHREYRQGWTL
ncbi:MAG: Gfo/Idh/MocA family oxidoreductase [Planctomycetes bacterium]|nr:Gfo/Idh/MocA family oxidoreductase [Planctomycetota bacterium]